MSRDDIASSAGYNQEDAYFAEHDRELIAKKRTELDESRKIQQEKSEHGAYWMVCPKCGGQMEELEFHGIMIDKCKSCGGIYFDQGEVDLLIEHTTGGGFFKRLFS